MSRGRGTDPQRSCVGCGGRASQSELLRIQPDCDGELQVVSSAGHGRSAYIHPSADCRDGLLKSKGKGLSRSLRNRYAREALERFRSRMDATSPAAAAAN